jgi:putative MATE family efflux protein
MENKSNTRNMLLTATPLKLMISLGLPAIVGMVVVGLYNLMDKIFVGQMINKIAMGAVSVAYPFTLINSGISTLIGVGSASILSRAIGKKDQNTVDKIMGNLVAINIILGLLVTILGIIFAPNLLRLSGAEGEILASAIKYLRIIFIGSFFVNFSQSANMVMRGEGVLKKAMLIMSTGAILNIVLDPIMISILKSKNMGIEGAALATIIAQMITFLITLWYFLKKSKDIRINKIRLEKSLTKEMFAVGFSAMLMQVMQLVMQTILYNTASKYGGDTWQIILGAVLSVQAFAFIPLWGISQGFQPAAGTNYGAKEYDRVRQLTKVFAIGATVLSLIFYIPIMLFPNTILSWFIKDASIVSQGVNSLRMLFSIYIVFGFMITTITLLQSLGKASKAGILVLLRQLILFIPITLLLPKVMGIDGVFLAPVVTDLIVTILAIIMMISEFRKMPHKRIGY